jgi:hypothetical protein
MKPADSMTAPEIDRLGFQALCDALGLAGALRFLQQMGGGSGNYTRERAAILRGVSIETLAREARGFEKQRRKRRVRPVLRRR